MTGARPDLGRPLLAALLLLVGSANGDVPMHPALSVERLANGVTLIAVGASTGLASGLVLEVDSLHRLVWAYVRGDIPWVHTARRLAGGNTLVSATFDDRVLEFDPLGNPVWDYATGLSYPNEAFRLADDNTLITDRDNNRVIEVDSAGNIVWSYNNLLGPHHGNRLANGNTLICDSDHNEVVEVTPEGQVAWRYANNLYWPRSAQRLANGNTLITDSNNRRVIEVDSAGAIVWSYNTGAKGPYMALRLPNGNTLISSEDLVSEVSPALSIVWQYPPPALVAEPGWVTNPASGCSLYVHIHRPQSASADHKVPAVVLIPDLSLAGTAFDSTGLADRVATDEYAVLHFDADGRGRSAGVEDYNGTIHQEGLHACLETLAALDYVDTSRLGIYAQGYGVVMATGMLARHRLPSVRFLLDFEGPSDRYQVCADSGGHVPVSPDSESFWQEREAARFIRQVPCAYLRIQTETDHTGRIPDNHHCIALVDSATAKANGGAGICVWTRVNDSVMNAENIVYTVTQPPAFITEIEEHQFLCRELLYLHELETATPPGIASGSSFTVHRSSLSVSPNPCRGSATVRISDSSFIVHRSSLSVYDASGRAVLKSPIAIRQSPFALELRSMPAGVYILRLNSAGRLATARLVVD